MTLEQLADIDDKEEFETELEVFLSNHFDRLPLEDACEHGGFPDPEDFSIYDVKQVSREDRRIQATFSISFTESVNTSCADCVVPFQHNVDCEITIDASGLDYHISAVSQGDTEYDWEF